MAQSELHRIIEQASLPRPVAFEARIAEDATAFSDEVQIIIPAFSEKHRLGPCPWQPRPGSLDMPSRGDRCLVAQSHEKLWWILVWWPY